MNSACSVSAVTLPWFHSVSNVKLINESYVKSLFSTTCVYPEHSFVQCVFYQTLFTCHVVCTFWWCDCWFQQEIFAGNQNSKLGKGTDLNYWQLEFFYKKCLLPVVSSLDGLGWLDKLVLCAPYASVRTLFFRRLLG